MKHKGFTIIELLVVIAVIAVLASIVIVSYGFMRGDSMDAKIKTVVKTAGDALALKEGQTGTRTDIGTGFFNGSNGMDSLVPKYLKQGYRDGLESKRVSDPNRLLAWFNCNDGGGGFVIYASLNNPTADDTAKFNKYKLACGQNGHPLFAYDEYNYAQVF